MNKIKNQIYINPDIKDLIPKFLSIKQSEISSLEIAIEKKDIKAIAQLAHKIRGSAGSYGFRELGALAAQLESLAQTEVKDEMKTIVSKMKDIIYNSEIIYEEPQA